MNTTDDYDVGINLSLEVTRYSPTKSPLRSGGILWWKTQISAYPTSTKQTLITASVHGIDWIIDPTDHLTSLHELTWII